jgi:hypothetical protein
LTKSADEGEQRGLSSGNIIINGREGPCNGALLVPAALHLNGSLDGGQEPLRGIYGTAPESGCRHQLFSKKSYTPPCLD